MARHDLAALRRAAGLSQEGLAELLHVDRTTAGRWEQGTSLPQPWNRRPLAGALGVSLGELDRLLAVPGGAGARWQDGAMERRPSIAWTSTTPPTTSAWLTMSEPSWATPT